MSIAKKLSGVARGPADVSWDLDYAYYSGGSEGGGASSTFNGISLTSGNLQSTYNLGTYVSPDGTKAYGTNGTFIAEYTLSTPYNITTVTNQSLYAHGFGSCEGIVISSDGVNIYIDTNDTIRHLTMSTAWDISTASSTGNSIAAAVSRCRDIALASDGSVLFHSSWLSGSTTKIFTFNMSTPYDISTASAGTTVDLSSFVTEVDGLAVSSDGSELYITDDTSNNLYVFAMDTPNDISTLRYISGSALGTGVWETLAQAGSFFYPRNGSTSIPMRSINNRGIEGLDGAAYTGKSFNFSTNSTNVKGLFLKPDGTKIYVADGVNNTVDQYSLSTAYDVTTASYDSKLLDVSVEVASIQGIYFKDDGTELYVVDFSGQTVEQYTLSTAWDVSTGSATTTLSISAQVNGPSGLHIGNGGTEMYVVDLQTDAIDQYTLSTAWDLSTATHTNNISVLSQDSSPRGVSLSSDGTKLFMLGEVADDVFLYRLTTPYDLSTAIYTGVSYAIAETTTPWEMFISGGFMYVSGNTTHTIYQYVLGGVDHSEGNNSLGFCFNDDGTMFFSSSITTDTIYAYNLSTPYDVSTASYSGDSLSVAVLTNPPRAIGFKSDGTKLYVAHEPSITEYPLSTAWDITSAGTATTHSFGTAVFNGALTFSDDGTKLFAVDIVSENFQRYDLSTAWDITSETLNGSSINLTTKPNSIGVIADSGSRVFCYYSSGNEIFSYTLSTPYDLSTATLESGTFDTSVFGSLAGSLFIKPDGTSFWVGKSTDPQYLLQFTIGIQ